MTVIFIKVHVKAHAGTLQNVIDFYWSSALFLLVVGLQNAVSLSVISWYEGGSTYSLPLVCLLNVALDKNNTHAHTCAQSHNLLQHKAKAWRSFYYLSIIIMSWWWSRSITLWVLCLFVCYCFCLFSFVFGSFYIFFPNAFIVFFNLLCLHFGLLYKTYGDRPSSSVFAFCGHAESNMKSYTNEQMCSQFKNVNLCISWLSFFLFSLEVTAFFPFSKISAFPEGKYLYVPTSVCQTTKPKLWGTALDGFSKS